MKAELLTLCETFIANRDIAKETFKWDSYRTYPICANIFLARNAAADAQALLRCRDIIKEQT